MGIVMQRRRKRQAAKAKRQVLTAVLVAGVIAALGFAPQIQTQMDAMMDNVQTFSQSVQQEMSLPAYDVYALQLAVFDSGERAASELARLQALGVRCVIWQKERMRIVADAAFSREALNAGAAKGQEAYIIRDTLEAVSLRLSADALGVVQAKALLELPDQTLKRIIGEKQTPLEQITVDVNALAEEALAQPMENALYIQLAKSLVSWSALMKQTLAQTNDADARSYGAVSMYALCRELRQALRALSTASAQRTPSTAAEVIPPA